MTQTMAAQNQYLMLSSYSQSCVTRVVLNYQFKHLNIHQCALNTSQAPNVVRTKRAALSNIAQASTGYTWPGSVTL